MTPNEKTLLDELLKLHADYENGSEALQSMYKSILSENKAIKESLNVLAMQVEHLQNALDSSSAKN